MLCLLSMEVHQCDFMTCCKQRENRGTTIAHIAAEGRRSATIETWVRDQNLRDGWGGGVEHGVGGSSPRGSKIARARQIRARHGLVVAMAWLRSKCFGRAAHARMEYQSLLCVPPPRGGGSQSRGVSTEPLGHILLRLCPMPLVHALAGREATQARARALQEEGPAMAEVTAVGRTAFLASRARRSEAWAPRPLYPTEFDDLFRSAVFEACLARTRLPLLARALKDGRGPGTRPTAPDEEMPQWLGIGSSTAFFDLRLGQALAAGTRQVVILGSGLDCRAVRVPRPPNAERLVFVEVDEGPLLDFKVGKLAAAGYQPYPARLLKGNYLKFDVCRELEGAGVDPALPVFILWEANSMYLPPSQALDVVRRLFAAFPHSTLAFDYFTPPVAGPHGPGPTGDAETDRELEIVVRAVGDGEWLLIGPWDTKVAQRELGLEVLEDLSLPEVIRLVRGDVASPLLARHRREFEVGIHACQRFCVARPGKRNAGG